MKTPSAFSRNLVAIVMIPVIIGAHYTWYRLQKIDALVNEHERRNSPFASLFGYKPAIVQVSQVSETAYEYEIQETNENNNSYMPFYDPDSSDIDYDPFCDPAKPKIVTLDDITAAAYKIQGGVFKTPCVRSHMEPMCGVQIYYKCEHLQYTGSFKERGARNAIMNLSPELKKKGTIACSLGNHSQGMSYHGKMLEVPTTVVMPIVAPLMKVEKCRSYGANVILHGNNFSEAKHQAMKLAKEKGLAFINGYDHPDIIAGQGTVGLEILDQIPDVEAVLVPCGGGGLLAGVSIALKALSEKCLVYGVETDKCASMTESLKAGKPVPYTIGSTLADGLAVANVGVNAFASIKPLVDKMVVVTEDWTARAILKIAELEKYVVEGGGAVTTAAILSGLVPELKGKKVVCLISGGNIDTSILSACFDRGLVAEQRLFKFKVNISKYPGSMGLLLSHIAKIGVKIKDLAKESAWIKGNIFQTRIKVVCETRGPDHVQELKNEISKNYNEVWFQREDDRRFSLTEP